MLKKIFIISTVLLLVSTIFFVIYIVAFKNESTDIKKKSVEKGQESGVQKLMSEKLINITSEPVISAVIGPDGNTIRYYNKIDGRAWTMTTRGTNKESISNETRGVPQTAKWSKDGKSTILTYDNGEIYVINHSTGEENKLRDGMDNVEWANNRILYKYYNNETSERSLNIANTDGTNWKKIADLQFKDTSFVQIPSSILAAFWPTEDVNIVTELFKVNTVSQSEPNKIFTNKTGADYSFSPDGKKVIVSYSDKNGEKIMLGIMDVDGSNYNDLLVPTIVQKIAWSADSKFIYYAQPNDVPENAIWPNDYNNGKFTTSDTFYKMDVESGKKDRLIELDEITEKVDAVNLFLDPKEDRLFFINKINGLLYRLNL